MPEDRAQYDFLLAGWSFLILILGSPNLTNLTLSPFFASTANFLGPLGVRIGLLYPGNVIPLYSTATCFAPPFCVTAHCFGRTLQCFFCGCSLRSRFTHTFFRTFFDSLTFCVDVVPKSSLTHSVYTPGGLDRILYYEILYVNTP